MGEVSFDANVGRMVARRGQEVQFKVVVSAALEKWNFLDLGPESTLANIAPCIISLGICNS